MTVAVGGGLESVSLVVNEHKNAYRAENQWILENKPSLYDSMLKTAETVATRYGISREALGFYPEEHGVPSYDELIYVANPETMDSDMIRRFLAATEKATQFIVNHPQESWEIFASTSAELQDELNERAWADTIPRFALRPEALDRGRYARFEAFLAEAGLIEGTRRVSDLAIDLGAQ